MYLTLNIDCIFFSFWNLARNNHIIGILFFYSAKDREHYTIRNLMIYFLNISQTNNGPKI